MVKIKTVEDIKAVSEKILGYLVQGKLTYFGVSIAELDEFSECFFTPTSKLPDNSSMIMVEDYEKVLKILLSHPKISHLEYDEKNNRVLAIFDSPYPPDRGDDFGENGY